MWYRSYHFRTNHLTECLWTSPGSSPSLRSGTSLTLLGFQVIENEIFRWSYANIPGPPRTRISFAEKCVHGVLIMAGTLAGPMYILTQIENYKKRDWASVERYGQLLVWEINSRTHSFPVLWSWFYLYAVHRNSQNHKVNLDLTLWSDNIRETSWGWSCAKLKFS